MLTWGQDSIFKELTIMKKWKFGWSQDLILYKEELNEKFDDNTFDGYSQNNSPDGQTDNIC